MNHDTPQPRRNLPEPQANGDHGKISHILLTFTKENSAFTVQTLPINNKKDHQVFDWQNTFLLPEFQGK